MKVFRRLEEVEAVGDATLREVVRAQLQALIGGLASVGHVYDPENDGCVVLVEPGDGEAEAVSVFGRPFAALGWEGVWWAHPQASCAEMGTVGIPATCRGPSVRSCDVAGAQSGASGGL